MLHVLPGHSPTACRFPFAPPALGNLWILETNRADIIGSVTLLVVKGDERVGAYRQQMQHLQAYTQMNALPQARCWEGAPRATASCCSWGGVRRAVQRARQHARSA